MPKPQSRLDRQGMSSPGNIGSVSYTDAQYQQAAAYYSQHGSLPSSWGSQIQALNTGYGGSSGSAPPPPTSQTLQTQAVTSTAAAAQAAWMAGLTTNTQGGGSSGSVAWVQSRNAQGQVYYVNTVTGETSRTNPATAVAPPPPAFPTIGDVSAYLQKNFAAGSGSPQPTAGQLAAIAAGSAERAWLAGLPEFRLGSASMGSYGVGSVGGAQTTFGSGSGSGSSSPYSGTGRSIMYFGGDNSIDTVITKDEARGIQTSDNTPSEPAPPPTGPIVTLLDLTNRDIQENDIFPIATETTWFTRDTERRVLSFVPVVQETPLRGPGAFGQRFTFDLGSVEIGDLLLGTALQIRLDHWLDPQTQNMYAAGRIDYATKPLAWEYANSLGTSIIQLAELEIDGKTAETIDGDFIHTFSALYPDFNAQIGIAYDHLGNMSIQRLKNQNRSPALFPVENGNLNCILPFFYMRTRLQAALPMVSVREGFVKIHITLRPFQECVRQIRGFRDTCDATPLNTEFPFTFPTCSWAYSSEAKNGVWDVNPQMSFIYTMADGTAYTWSYSIETNRGSWDTPPPFNISVASSYTWTPGTPGSWSPSNPRFDIAYLDPVVAGKYYYWDGVPQAWRGGLSPAGQPNAGPPLFRFTYGSGSWRSMTGDWSVAPPPFKSVQLLTYGAFVDGPLRTRMLREPFELMHRELHTFYFDEPLKYAIGKREDAVRIQLPLEANHPIEQIIWFVRRKAVRQNNEWTNFCGAVETEWNPVVGTIPMLVSAAVQVNGTVICDADEQFYREGISSVHRGGYAAYSRFIYGYSFAKSPGEHQPSGSLNASRVNSLRLTLDVKTPSGVADPSWEVKVFCIGINWMRFENGLANPMFED